MRLGRSLRATANHRFLTIEGWKRLDELRPGDRLAVPRQLPAAAPAEPMRREELALLGQLIGDGCTLARHAIQYTSREPDLASTVAELATACFAGSVAPRIHRERRWFQVYLASTRHHTRGRRSAVAEWLDALGGVWDRRSHEKRVPPRVFAQDAGGIAHFLRHLWATDGCVRPPKGRSAAAVYYATSSEGLASDVQSLLLRIGIQARVERHPQKGKGRDQYHVRVSGRPDLVRFADRVGAVGAYKSTAVAELLAGLPERSNTNRDIVPREVWRRFVLPAMAQRGMTGRQLHTAIETAYGGTSIYGQNLGRERALRVALAVGSEALRRLAESDVYWDEIVSLVPDGEEEVFDLTVPGPSNFVANDVLVHNSIEQDADLVAFVYRDEIYNPDDPSKKGLAELILAKHRNGETGTIDLAFFGETTTFRNLARDHMGGGPAF
jgi:replicative DNA helicase